MQTSFLVGAWDAKWTQLLANPTCYQGFPEETKTVLQDQHHKIVQDQAKNQLLPSMSLGLVVVLAPRRCLFSLLFWSEPNMSFHLSFTTCGQCIELNQQGSECSVVAVNCTLALYELYTLTADRDTH